MCSGKEKLHYLVERMSQKG